MVRRVLAWTVIAVFFAAVAAFASAPQSPIIKLLPTKDSVRGWQVVEGSLLYGKGEGLTEIYNGACPQYLEQGFVEAAQQIYQTNDKKLFMEIIVNKLKSEKDAKAYFDSQHKKLSGNKPTKVGNGRMFIVSKKPVQGCLVMKSYIVTAVPAHDGTTATAHSTAFLRTTAKNLEKAK